MRVSARGILTSLAGLLTLVCAAASSAQPIESKAPVPELYDDFEGGLFPGLIDPAKWKGSEWEGTSGSNTETTRSLVGLPGSRKLLLSQLTWGDTASNTGFSGGGSLRLRIKNPSGINLLAATVTVDQVIVTPCAANRTSTRARAGLQGAFFNDGSSQGPNDQTGDYWAAVQMVQDTSSGFRVEGFVFRCDDPVCNTTTDIGTGAGFTHGWTIGAPNFVAVVIDRANRQFVFSSHLGEPTQETRVVPYGAVPDTAAPGYDAKELRIRNTVANCTDLPLASPLPQPLPPTAYMRVFFDNVYIQR